MKNKTLIRQGGIYKYPGTADYAMYFNGSLYFIEPEMPCLDMDVEHTSNLNDMELLDGYALACVHVISVMYKYEWQIRNSGRKNTDDYIIACGQASKRFMEQINQLKRSM